MTFCENNFLFFRESRRDSTMAWKFRSCVVVGIPTCEFPASLRFSVLLGFGCSRWLLAGQWDSMEDYACMIPRDTYDGAFYRSVLALHMDQFTLAQQVT